MSYDNTNSGAIFKNEKTKETQPDYKGKLNVQGKDFDVSGWIRTSKDGKSFLSLKIQEPFKKDELISTTQKIINSGKFNLDF